MKLIAGIMNQTLNDYTAQRATVTAVFKTPSGTIEYRVQDAREAFSKLRELREKGIKIIKVDAY